MPECACPACRRLCTGLPGWFLPGEPARAAAELGLALPEFSRQYLILDYWVGGAPHGGDQLVLTPRKDHQAGQRIAEFADTFTLGGCVLLTPQGCRLSAPNRPAECRLSFGCRGATEQGIARSTIMAAWRDQPAELTIYQESYRE